MSRKILVAGASGQIGTELVIELRKVFGNENVIAADLKEPNAEILTSGPFVELDIMNAEKVKEVVRHFNIDTFYHLVAMLSATAEKFPTKGWDLNMISLFNVLELAKEGLLKKVFWPSSIAVFGPTTPRENTPQYTVMEPSTVYGISKLAGERWCEYYFKKYGVDVRSIRYPGLISYKSLPGGGTTDYAVDIYYSAKRDRKYNCFLNPGTYLPMMFMEDAIRATIMLTEAPAEKVKIRSSYNLAGISFDPEEIAASIKVHIPDFSISYSPDFRQAIADSWPKSIDDTKAQQDWGWQTKFDLVKMTKLMLENVSA
ncbi:MAG: NAD-dependent epimerase/dehydratase family protein [Flavobacteriales bacterium]